MKNLLFKYILLLITLKPFKQKVDFITTATVNLFAYWYLYNKKLPILASMC